MRSFAALLMLVAAVPQAGGKDAPAQPNPSALCLAAVADAEQKHQTPPGLLATIAKVESGRSAGGTLAPWPWTIDSDGRSLFFATKDEAVAWARQAQARGVGYIDVGCMQIDLPMHPAAFRTLEDAFDPVANADYAGRFLRELYSGPAAGNWYTATGMYHSRTPDLAAAYREAVAAVASGRPIPAVGAGASRLQFIRLALAGGGSIRINLARQPSVSKRKMSACQVAEVLGPLLRSPPKACGRQAATRRLQATTLAAAKAD